MTQREYKIRYRMRHLMGHTPACMRGKAMSRGLHREYRGFYKSYLRIEAAEVGKEKSWD